MSALRDDVKTISDEQSNPPYPSWSVLADAVNACNGLPTQDTQAEKEERIWRALAEEPVSESSDSAEV